ncbi:hypothetical protein BDEG_22762 [Batrachochytrium dendrobatidis JEL423]|uniref:Tail specific protease domain-containing protein n=1 Tax=Batrachochytrium dendrobatidis (strain JEL423) TaxID=403673 RepID=A0A177WFQ5_BATDL|nr:hypothetical protein BDEG_22762 [Batrachochytrium dendrobatidis JEL423]
MIQHVQAWVNFESKMKHHGQEANPYPALEHIRNNIETLTDEQIQLGLLDAFTRTRDAHTFMKLAGPYSCFFVTTGIFFQFIDGPGDMIQDPTIVIARPVDDEIFDLLRNTAYSQIRVGDQLVSINGLTFYQWKEKHRNVIGGSTESHSQRLALEYLTFRYGYRTPLPSEDSIKLKLKSRGGIIYEVDALHMSKHRYSCWKYSTGSKQSISDTGRLSKRDLRISFYQTSILELSWTIWRPNDQNMGIIRLASFSCTSRTTNTQNTLEAILEVTRLLKTVLKDTNSILIDVREGAGGCPIFANAIPQLFKSKLEPFQVKYLINKVTSNMFSNSPKGLETSRDAWSKTPAGSKYSVLHYIVDPKELGTYNPIYDKPMGVFTNGNCVSACEVMTESVQSFGIGTVFGEDVTTAGAGANVWDLDPELIFYDPTDFKPMPFKKELTSDTKEIFYNKMAVGHRAFVRNVNHKEHPIEDIGIVSNVVIRPRLEDIISGGTINSQYDYIGNYLIKADKRPAKTV